MVVLFYLKDNSMVGQNTLKFACWRGECSVKCAWIKGYSSLALMLIDHWFLEEMIMLDETVLYNRCKCNIIFCLGKISHASGAWDTISIFEFLYLILTCTSIMGLMVSQMFQVHLLISDWLQRREEKWNEII